VKWILGCPRSGTKSAAQEYGGVHEPQPWIDGMAQEYYRRLADLESWDSLEPALRGIIEERRDLNVGCVSDQAHSYVIPLILQIDPDPSFVWLLRDPFSWIASILSANSWDGEFWKPFPTEGYEHPNRPDQIQCAINFWLRTNQRIDKWLFRPEGTSTEKRTTLSLKPHLNRHSASPDFRFSAWESQEIAYHCWESWERHWLC